VEEVAERFLQELLQHRVERDLEHDRTRMHRIVGTAAAYWLCHPKTALRFHQTKHTITLGFEGPIDNVLVPLLSFRVHFPTQEYRFNGPPERSKSMSHQCVETLKRVKDLYIAFLGAGDSATTISIVLKGERMPDLLPLIDETRRILDGGADVAVVPNLLGRKPPPRNPAKSVPSEPAPSKGLAAAPAAASVAVASTSLTPPARPGGAVPLPEVAMSYVMLACPNPSATSAFHARLFQRRVERKTKDGHYAELRLGEIVLAFQDDLSKEERKLYGYGPVERNRGWGALFVVRVSDFEACKKRAKRMDGALVSENLESKSFVVRDPAGYLFEVVPAPASAPTPTA
jgi:catechol 2,3-dioxygenase-like lactoylglutathione lyase family enzyme